MTETDLLDSSFMFLYSRQKESIIYKSLDVHISDNEVNSVRLLNKIFSIGFLDREVNLQQTHSHNNNIYNYSINSKGIDFIDTLPIEFTNKPYTYYKKSEEDEAELKKEKDLLDDKVKKITVGNISLNKYAPILSLIVALFAIAVPVIMKKMSEDKIIKTESTIPQIEKVIENQHRELQILQHNLDSLQKILKTSLLK